MMNEDKNLILKGAHLLLCFFFIDSFLKYLHVIIDHFQYESDGLSRTDYAFISTSVAITLVWIVTIQVCTLIFLK
jgi:hypothetical protein